MDRPVSRHPLRDHLLGLSVLLLPFAGSAAVDCVPDGTLLEQNLCATLDAERAERELEQALAMTRERVRDDPNALSAHQHAHEAWQRYRDAALAAAFPCYHDDLTVCFGAETPGRFARFKARLARERTAHLQPRPDAD